MFDGNRHAWADGHGAHVISPLRFENEGKIYRLQGPLWLFVFQNGALITDHGCHAVWPEMRKTLVSDLLNDHDEKCGTFIIDQILARRRTTIFCRLPRHGRWKWTQNTSNFGSGLVDSGAIKWTYMYGTLIVPLAIRGGCALCARLIIAKVPLRKDRRRRQSRDGMSSRLSSSIPSNLVSIK